MPDSEFDKFIERLEAALKIRITSQLMLADLLEIKQSNISSSKKRDAIPANWREFLLERYGINPLWLKYGNGNILLGNAPQTIKSAVKSTTRRTRTGCCVHKPIRARPTQATKKPLKAKRRTAILIF